MFGRDLPQFKNLPIGSTAVVDDIEVKCVEIDPTRGCGGCHFDDQYHNPNYNGVTCPADRNTKSIGSTAYCMDTTRTDGKHVKFMKVRHN